MPVGPVDCAPNSAKGGKSEDHSVVEAKSKLGSHHPVFHAARCQVCGCKGVDCGLNFDPLRL